ncbi:MAG: DmpA family aminopeptidase [Planctomycetota bacterium]|jgi:D-aminopeptidase
MFSLVLAVLLLPFAQQEQEPRPRARDAGIVIGSLPTGKENAISDVPGVLVGHATLEEGDSVRSGVTVILPHARNLYREKVPAAVYLMNAYGKLVGSTQVKELGEIESPIALTSTLNVGLVADALVGHMLDMKGNEQLRSVNVLVGETNDGYLNDIRSRPVRAEHVLAALAAAKDGPVEEGAVGAGKGTICFGWKGGIGTASRKVSGFTLGVLVQSNFGGDLTIQGKSMAELRPQNRGRDEEDEEAGSCMIVIATDAPLDSRLLLRLAKRAPAGMARIGASFSNGSGDYVIAFSTAESQIIRAGVRRTGGEVLSNGAMSPLFRAAAEATEEAILNSMFKAVTTEGRDGNKVDALPIDKVQEILGR